MGHFKGKRLLYLVFSKESYAGYRQRVRFYNRYLLPFMLLGLCFSIFLFHNRDNIDASTIFVFSIFVTLGICGVLYFRLLQETTARQKAEADARVDSARLASIYDGRIVGLLYTRFDGVITDANEAFLEIIGYTRSDLEMRKISWVDMTPPEYAEVSQLALRQLRATGICEPFSKEYWRKDGTRVSVLLGSSLLNNGDDAQILTYAINITNLKEAEKREQELYLKMQHQQEDMFRILNNAPIAIVIRRGPELKVEYANQTALNYTSFDQRKVLGTSAKDFHAKLKTSYDTSGLMDVYRSGKPIKGKAQQVKYDRDGTGELAEGWFEYLWEPTFDESGDVNGVATFTFEVSDLMRANQELYKNEQRFRFIADAIPHKIWTSDANGTATYYNQGWTEYLQEEDIEKLRKKAWDSVHPEERLKVELDWKNTVENGGDLEIEHRLRRHDGVYQWHLTRACSCKDDEGRVTMYVGTSTNIHDQKVAGIAVRLASEKKDEFLGIATHELRTPITSMKAALQSLERSAIAGVDLNKSLSLVGLANKQVNKLTDIVNDLVDVNKIQSGKLQLNKSQFKLSDSVKEMIEELQHHQPGSNFEIAIQDEEPLTADKIRIDQVIMNLLSNALKYSAAKGIIQVAIESIPAGTKCTIADEGIGIPSDLQPYVFDRFFRVHASSQRFSGLGLGLFISSEIIKQHGGTIGVESEEGKGSRFWFILP